MDTKTTSSKAQQLRMHKILKRLQQTYASAQCALNFKNAYELLVATILSAQCTDKRVNLVTPAVFKKYPTPQALAKADTKDLESLIRSTGFFRNKAKALTESAKDIVSQFGGKVPNHIDQLTKLHGIGRKTANVILGNVFHQQAIVVDTHVGRLVRRMGFSKSHDPVKIEFEMMKIVPEKLWTQFSHLLIFHGRARCGARNPDCLHCEARELCPKVGVS